MKYFEEMLDKYGFNDGECVTAGAFHYREVYLRVVNALAKKNGSSRRMIAWERPGMHNYCLVLTVASAYYDALTDEQRFVSNENFPPEVLENDEALDAAITTAHEMSLDDVVEVKTTIARASLKKTLRTLHKPS